MPIRLTNINVEWISLVKKGANKRSVIFKSAGKKTNAPELRMIPIEKVDEEKRMIFGVVYAPDDLDTDGEFANAEDIEKAAHAFMKDLKNTNIDKQHNENPEKAFVAESWIVRKGDPLFSDEKEGAWAVGIKIEDEDLWKSAKEGDIGGLSMGGTADKVVEKALSFEDAESMDGLFEHLMTLERSIQSIMSDEVVEGKKDKISESVDQFKTRVLEGVAKNDKSGILSRFLKIFKRQPISEENNDMDKKETETLIDEKLNKFKEDITKELSPEENKDTLAKIVKGAFEEMVKPLNERIEKVEKASPGSAQSDDDTTTEKSDEELEALGADIAKMANGE